MGLHGMIGQIDKTFLLSRKLQFSFDKIEHGFNLSVLGCGYGVGFIHAHHLDFFCVNVDHLYIL